MSNEEKKCVFCDMTFQNQELLREHFREHANKTIDMKGRQTTVPDTLNNSSGNSKSKADRHKQIVQCEACSEVFDTVTKAIQHKYKKHPELPSKNYCCYCGMLFPLQCILTTHLLNHDTSYIPEPGDIWPCTECEAIFYNRQALAYHTGSTHKRNHALLRPTVTAPPSKKIKVNNANEALSAYYCHLCGTEYIVKFNLQKHLERLHTKTERDALPECLIKCTTCEAWFYNKKAYETHNVYHKPDDLYVTSEEQRLQTITRVDQDFDMRRVQNLVDKYVPTEKKSVRKSTVANETVANSKSGDVSDSELSPASPADSTDDENESDKIAKDKPAPPTETDAKDKCSASPPVNKLRVVDSAKLMGVDSRGKMEVIDGGDIKMIKRKGKIIVVRKLDTKIDKPVQKCKKKIIIHDSGVATMSKMAAEKASAQEISTSDKDKDAASLPGGP